MERLFEPNPAQLGSIEGPWTQDPSRAADSAGALLSCWRALQIGIKSFAARTLTECTSRPGSEKAYLNPAALRGRLFRAVGRKNPTQYLKSPSWQHVLLRAAAGQESASGRDMVRRMSRNGTRILPTIDLWHEQRFCRATIQVPCRQNAMPICQLS